ncbi:mercury(II) reductase [Rothia sp. LK2492]|uniref:mercury(II) reductase n=1 Tax=Rothia sp. LK2492 TaxID=3114370 RepID=UPI0034CD5E1C
MERNLEFDLVVVGSGGAGMAAAIEARRAGSTVLVVERGTIGGTCVNIGCVPSKTLLAAASTRQAALTNPFPGAPTAAMGVDLGSLVEQKDQLITQLRETKYADVAEAHGFEVCSGEASFWDPDTLVIDGKPVTTSSIVLATGAVPARPKDVTGLGEVKYLTSTTAMELTELPESMIIIGGGYVGIEQAQLFAGLGVQVTIVGRIAPTAEPEMTAILRHTLIQEGIRVVQEHATSVAQEHEHIQVRTLSGRSLQAERLLVATGRRPSTDYLNLAAAGIATDCDGFIRVDEHQRTTNQKVFAAGDVTAAPQYVYVAAATGKAAATNAVRIDPRATVAEVDYTGLPAVIFSRPQLATAGFTEAAARAAGHRCESRVLSFKDLPRALVNHDTRGAIKMIAETGTDRILGISIIGDHAAELLLPATYAITAGMTTRHIADTWAPYLTFSEALRLVAGTFHNEMPTSCCA